MAVSVAVAVAVSSTDTSAGIPPARWLPPSWLLAAAAVARALVAADPGSGVPLAVAGARRAAVPGAESDGRRCRSGCMD